MLCWTPLYVYKHKQCKQDITPPTNNLRSIHYAILIEKHVIRPCAAWLNYLCFQCHSDINKRQRKPKGKSRMDNSEKLATLISFNLQNNLVSKRRR